MTCSVGTRVLMLLENFPYAQDIRVGQEAKTLVSAGYRVSVICPKAPGEPWSETLEGVRVYRYQAPLDGNSFLGYVWEYSYSMMATFILSLYLFIRVDFDIIHAHNPPDTFVFIGAFYKLFGKHFIFDHHDLSPEMYYARFRGRGNRWVHKVLVLLERWSCRLADHVIATNESYRALEIERHSIPQTKVSVVRNGPDLKRVRPAPEDARLRARASTIVGYVGTLGYQDGVDYLIRAIHRMVHDLGRKDVLCVIIGRGDAAEELAELTRSLDLENHVWLTGYVTDQEMFSYLSTADICADPAPSNPFNDRSTMIKMMEYLLMG